MKANFDKCFEWLLAHEGGFVDHPEDPGGMTNLGITRQTLERFLWRDVTEGEMRSLTPAAVEPVYRALYWDKVRADDLPSGVDWAVFDWAVNSGPPRAAKALQSLVGVTPDGAVGPITLGAVVQHKPSDLIDQLHAKREAFYRSLTTFNIFGRGWLRRNDATKKQAYLLL